MNLYYRTGIFAFWLLLFIAAPYFFELNRNLYFFRAITGMLLFRLIYNNLKFIFYHEKLGNRMKTVAVSTLLPLGLLIFLELLFMFIPRSHNVGYTYASRIWFENYWNPINSYGFRDAEPGKSDSVILFTGDSYTAGHGIREAEKRFSNLTGKALKNRKCINIGMNGQDTRAAYSTLQSFVAKSGVKPSAIVLQYFGNDIEQAAYSSGMQFPGFKPLANTSLLTGVAIKCSYLFNYFFWSIPRGDTRSYVDFLEQAYRSDKVRTAHETDLAQFVEFAKANKAELIVVIFPFMQDPEGSKKLYGNHIADFFGKQGIKTIQVADLLIRSGLSPSERVVNNNDGHASEKVQELVAAELTKSLNQ